MKSVVRAVCFLLCSLALASCQPAGNAPAETNEARPANTSETAQASTLVDTFDDGVFPDHDDLIDEPPALRAHFWASKTTSRCTPAALYPNGEVPPAFYTDWELPQRDVYRKCLEDEARREGRSNVRLAVPSDFPRTGTCYETRIKQASGSYIAFENGIDQSISYGRTAVEFLRSRVGDRARVCVVHIPQNCPANDLRGIRYSTWNRRTGDRWEEYAAISLHLCWGA